MPRLMDCAMASPVAHRIPEVTICVRTGFCASFVWYHAHTPRNPPTPAIAGWLTGCFQYLLIKTTNSRPQLFFTSPTRRFFEQLTYTHGGMTKSGNCDVVFPMILKSTNLRDETGLVVRWGREIDEEREVKRRGKTGEGARPWRLLAMATCNGLLNPKRQCFPFSATFPFPSHSSPLFSSFSPKVLAQGRWVSSGSFSYSDPYI